MALVQSRRYGRLTLKQTWAADPEVCQHRWLEDTAKHFVCSECGKEVAL